MQRRTKPQDAADKAFKRVEVDVLLCASAMDPPSRIDNPEEVERTTRGWLARRSMSLVTPRSL
jgi:hypothetical protein